MPTKLLGIFGTGGCGRGVMPIARTQYAGSDTKIVFIDDSPAVVACNGQDVIDFARFVADPAAEKWVTVAIADPATRARTVARCVAARLSFFEVRAASAIIMDDVQIGEGALISPFVTLTSNIKIGRHFHANLYAYVEHDCIIGDFVTFAPGAKCNGNVRIGDGAYIGSGAVIKQGTPEAPLLIGAGAIIGMGAVVTKSVHARATVVGNPARSVKR